MNPTDQTPHEPISAEWRPPSSRLILHDGIWRSDAISQISYPAQGNEACFQVEDQSYWFRHRIDCLEEVITRFPPEGIFWDIGGGNGFVAARLQARGIATALLEPGEGAVNARQRGVHRIVQATLDDAGFAPRSLPAVGVFDVLEHISDDAGFLKQIHDSMILGGRFYCTVPAHNALWSTQDVFAGHYRRYTRATLGAVLARAGFAVEFTTYLFSWLVPVVFLLRTLPSKMHLSNLRRIGTPNEIRSEHRLPRALSGIVGRVHQWESRRLRSLRPVPFGTSLLCVARAIRS